MNRVEKLAVRLALAFIVATYVYRLFTLTPLSADTLPDALATVTHWAH